MVIVMRRGSLSDCTYWYVYLNSKYLAHTFTF